MYKYMYTYTHTYTHIYIHTYTYVHIAINMDIYTCTRTYKCNKCGRVMTTVSDCFCIACCCWYVEADSRASTPPSDSQTYAHISRRRHRDESKHPIAATATSAANRTLCAGLLQHPRSSDKASRRRRVGLTHDALANNNPAPSATARISVQPVCHRKLPLHRYRLQDVTAAAEVMVSDSDVTLPRYFTTKSYSGRKSV